MESGLGLAWVGSVVGVGKVGVLGNGSPFVWGMMLDGRVSLRVKDLVGDQRKMSAIE